MTPPTPVFNLTMTSIPTPDSVQVPLPVAQTESWGQVAKEMAVDLGTDLLKGCLWVGGKVGKAALQATGSAAKLVWRKAVMEALFPDQEDVDEDEEEEAPTPEPAPGSSADARPEVIDVGELRRLHEKIEPKVYQVTKMSPKVNRRMFQIREALERGDARKAKRLAGSLHRLASLFEVS